MREIKFRAWVVRNESNAFFPDQESYMATQGEPDIETLQAFMFHYADEPLLMQYVGLKDKNGKEIYEGDVLKKTGKVSTFNGKAPSKKIVGNIKKVIFHEGAFRLVKGLVSNKYLLNSVAIWYYGFEIIGNIHENPDLLK